MSDPELNFSRFDGMVMDTAARMRRAGVEERADQVAASMATIRETLRNPGDLAKALQDVTDSAEAIMREVLEYTDRIMPGDPVR